MDDLLSLAQKACEAAVAAGAEFADVSATGSLRVLRRSA